MDDKGFLAQLELIGDEIKLAITMTDDLPDNLQVAAREWLVHARWLVLIKAHQYITDHLHG